MITYGSGQFQMIPVESLTLDKANPRVARFLEIYTGPITNEQMELALGAGIYEPDTGTRNNTTFHSLRESIKTNGGVIHPILVNKLSAGELIVIEGNTRTFIYRQFKSQGIQGQWETIPSLVYNNLDQAVY